MRVIFGVLSDNWIWQYINLAKLKLPFYNLKCSLRYWWDINLAPSEKITKLPNFSPSQNFYSYGIVTINTSALARKVTKLDGAN